MQLDQLKIVVTGAASGMGKCFAMELAKAGAQVAAADINAVELQKLEEESASFAGKIKGYTLDVSNEAQVESFFNQAWQDFGGLNGLINNAGLFRDGIMVKQDRKTNEIKKMSLQDWQKVIDVDLTGPFLCTREFAAKHVEFGDKAPAVVINISSVSRAGNVGQSNYSAAKAGLVADTVIWARELAPFNLRVGAIAPGFIETPILLGMKPEALEKTLAMVPMKRLGLATEIYAGVKFIIECDYFTGRCLDIDGGLRI
jgi:3-oxoacyl-[acyl-carrier protein] reductase